MIVALRTSPIDRRSRQYREALADLLGKKNTLDEVAERLAILPKSVYEIARRFEVATGMRFAWPWRTDERPGPKLAKLQPVSKALEILAKQMAATTSMPAAATTSPTLVSASAVPTQSDTMQPVATETVASHSSHDQRFSINA